MGNEQSRSSLLNGPEFLKNIQSQTPMPMYDPLHSEVHEISSHSPEHHRLVLEKVRAKKNYDCPFLVKIIDSHTLQSQNICSTVIKTFIVLEKPRSLAKQMETRMLHHTGFDEQELWSIIYSCASAIIFLSQNNVRASRMSAHNIFIDQKNNVKILDPEFVEGIFPAAESSEADLMSSISAVIRNLIAIRTQEDYSDRIRSLLAKMDHAAISFAELRQQILEDYISASDRSGENQCLSHSGICAISRPYAISQPYSPHKKNPNNTLKNSLNICINRQSQAKLSASVGRKPSATTVSRLGSSTKKKTAVDASCLQISTISSRGNRENRTDSDIRNVQGSNREYCLLQTLENQGSSNVSNLNDSHYFPKKTLFNRKRRNQRDQPIQTGVSSNVSTTNMSLGCPPPMKLLSSNLQRIRSYKSARVETRKQEQVSRNEQHAPVPDSQATSMITYHVDQQAQVSELAKQHQGYIYMKMSENTENSDMCSDSGNLHEQSMDEISMSQYKINVN